MNHDVFGWGSVITNKTEKVFTVTINVPFLNKTREKFIPLFVSYSRKWWTQKRIKKVSGTSN